MDVHREHLYAMLAKAAKATHTCQEAILSSVGERKNCKPKLQPENTKQVSKDDGPTTLQTT